VGGREKPQRRISTIIIQTLSTIAGLSPAGWHVEASAVLAINAGFVARPREDEAFLAYLLFFSFSPRVSLGLTEYNYRL
jgi:hypothetical protein